MIKDIPPFEVLTGNAAKLIYETPDEVEDGLATKSGLEAALNQLALLVFLIGLSPEDKQALNQLRQGSDFLKRNPQAANLGEPND